MQSLQPFHTFNIPANAREIIAPHRLNTSNKLGKKRKLKSYLSYF